MLVQAEGAEKRANDAEQEVKELKKKLEAAESVLKAHRSLGESLEMKVQRLKTEEEEEAEKWAKEAEERVGSIKMEKLEAESKLLKVEVAHASCKTHITELLASVEQGNCDMKAKEEAWSAEKEKLVEDVSDGFTAGVGQLKAYLRERYPSIEIDWSAIEMEDILAAEAEEEEKELGLEVGTAEVIGSRVETMGEGKEEGGVVGQVTEGSVTRAGGVVIEELVEAP